MQFMQQNGEPSDNEVLVVIMINLAHLLAVELRVEFVITMGKY